MYAFDVSHGTKADLYRDLRSAIDAFTADERDAIANMANAAALVWEFMPDLKWAGFIGWCPNLRMANSSSAHSRARPRASASRSARACAARPPHADHAMVEDVHAFPGHIACDAASRSELVVPVIKDGTLIAVLDLDSPDPARFDAEDAAGVRGDRRNVGRAGSGS